MRKFLISLLLASAAVTPALADPPTKAEREQAREERKKDREERQQSRQDARPERVQPQVQARQQPVQPNARVQTLDRTNRVNLPNARQVRVDQREQLQQNRIEAREQRQQDRVEAREIRQASRAPIVSNVPRPGTQPPARVDNRRSNALRWSTNWRHNNKYDWYNYRKKNHSRFHLGFYFDPFGWGYQPYQIGWRLWPSYYSNRYWINDPWQYRLPYAPPGYRWVRYWNDAVLVDTWTGEVVDVLYNFFW